MQIRIRVGTFRRFVNAARLTLALCAFAVCCRDANARQTPSADVLAIQTAIENGNRAYLEALKGHDARRFAALFAEDAISLPPSGPPIRGRANIEASISSAFGRVQFLAGSTHSQELQLTPGSVVEIGAYRYAILTDGVPEELHGRYLTMWRLIDGAWKISVDSSQPDAPAPEPIGTLAPVPSDAGSGMPVSPSPPAAGAR